MDNVPIFGISLIHFYMQQISSLEEVLGHTCTKLEMQRVTEMILNDPERVEELWQFAASSHSFAWRGMWALSHLNQQEPGLLTPYLGKIGCMVLHTTNGSLIREMLKILQFHPLGEEPSGDLLDFCFQVSASSAYPVSVRMNAMAMVYKFAEIYPEIIPEFVVVLEDVVEEPPSVGTKGWAQRLLKSLRKK